MTLDFYRSTRLGDGQIEKRLNYCLNGVEKGRMIRLFMDNKKIGTGWFGNGGFCNGGFETRPYNDARPYAETSLNEISFIRDNPRS